MAVGYCIIAMGHTRVIMIGMPAGQHRPMSFR
jgi:hypothetical protein